MLINTRRRKKENNVAKYPIPENTIDPRNPENFDIPLWVVYGCECFPNFLACKINYHTGSCNVWGLSIFRRSLGYRTLGVTLEKFERDNSSGYACYWFKDQLSALEYLRQLTAPPKP